MTSLSGKVLSATCSAATFTILTLVWWLATREGGASHLLPPPGAVLDGLRVGLLEGSLWPHVVFTLSATAAGWVLGCAAGIAAGALAGEWPRLSALLEPVVAALQSVPKVAIAPLFVAYFGFDALSKIVTVGLLCFFPCFVGTLAGMRSSSPELVDLYRGLGAGRWRTLWEVRLPGAAHHVFSALQVSVVLGFIACVVSEFIASRKGLGFLIKSRAGELDVTTMFTAIVVLTLMSVAGSGLMRLAHRRLVFWDRLGGAPR